MPQSVDSGSPCLITGKDILFSGNTEREVIERTLPKAVRPDQDGPKVLILENSRWRGFLLVKVIEGETKLNRLAVSSRDILDLDSQSETDPIQALES